MSRGSFCFSHYSAELHHRQNKPNWTTQEALVHHRTATGAQAAAVSWHQGRRRFSVQSFHDPRLSPGTTRVTQNQFTLLAVHSDILCVDGGFSGSTRYCEHAWSDQPGAIPTGKKIFLTPWIWKSALAQEFPARTEQADTGGSTRSARACICAQLPYSAIFSPKEQKESESTSVQRQKTWDRGEKRLPELDTTSEGGCALWRETDLSGKKLLACL